MGWSVKVPTLGLRKDPVHVQTVRDTARLLAELGHEAAGLELCG